MLPVAVACCLLLLHAACSRHMPVYSRLALASVAAARRHLLRRTSANYKLKYFLSVWVLKNCSRFRVFKTCRVFRSFRVFDVSSFRKFPSIVKFSRLFSNRLTLDKDTQKGVYSYIHTYLHTRARAAHPCPVATLVRNSGCPTSNNNIYFLSHPLCHYPWPLPVAITRGHYPWRKLSTLALWSGGAALLESMLTGIS